MRSDSATAPQSEQSARTRAADPALMTPEARIAELGEVLARGFARLRLDAARQEEAQCDR